MGLAGVSVRSPNDDPRKKMIQRLSRLTSATLLVAIPSWWHEKDTRNRKVLMLWIVFL